MLAPKVDADGNEVGGVPVVLLGAPLGTIPGLEHRGQRLSQGPDLLLRPAAWCLSPAPPRSDARIKTLARRWRERYGSHAGYVQP
jgi:hypothetical protein